MSIRPSARVLLAVVVVLVLAVPPSLALQPRSTPARFDALVLAEPGAALGTSGAAVAALPPGDRARALWERFSLDNGGWQSWLDERSGLPSLAIGRGIPWTDARAPRLEDLERLARGFLGAHVELLGSWDGQLELDRAASGPIGGNAWQVTFRQVVGGVPVQGARYDFHVVAGRLVAVGATRWARVQREVTARVGAADARASLDAYLGPAGAGAVVERAPAALVLIPVDPEGVADRAWYGARGGGYAHLLAWRFVLAVPGEPATWVAEVDADTGKVVAFFDDTHYARVQGGIYPVSNDGNCPTGCEQPGFPLPFADYTVNGGPVQAANDAGLYQCTTIGSTIRTTLAGPYIRVHDTCGAVNQSTACDDPLDLGFGSGTDCVVPPGSSPGNTHSARSSFYHLNRVMEKGRAWLPGNSWLRSQVTDNVNLNSTCNAFWDGSSVNFYKSGGGCRNTGEIAGVFVHEWGHGLDNYDGGGYDNPSEAYADIVAFFETRESCVGRGFFADDHNCGGYGDACLACSGIRDQDWDRHQSHAPVTPGGFIRNNCGGGGGPCGKEVHCEGYLAGEALWDLPVRDLPASGLDTASAWQLAERLFYVSRQGSGGNAYNCALPNADGCGTTSWFHKLRVADDDDGNLDNGTPHAAAIFRAFNRHGIACGAAGDPSNANSSTCPVLAAPNVAATAGSGAVQLTWSAVPGAASYRILRNDIGCERAQITIDTVAAPQTSYTDDEVPNGFTLYYRVQAQGANDACEGPVSECVSSAGQPFAGSVRFGDGAFGCASTITLRVTDGNVGASTVLVTVASDSEIEPETVVLTETLPGSSTFTGTIASTAGPAVHGDGALSLAAGDVITAAYRDADDGRGEPGLSWASARGDCSGPRIAPVSVTDITDGTAMIRWTTSEPTTGRVLWGTTDALGSAVSDTGLATTHALPIGPFGECGTAFFRVESTDAYGNTAVSDAGGAPYSFRGYMIPGTLFRDEFETAKGWTLEGEWQIGNPLGKGSAPGDPLAAFDGSKVLGHDLTGLGAHPGDYEPHTTERAISPVIDASQLVDGQLKFRRWLNVGGGGIAFVDVRQGTGWTEVWHSDSLQGVTESTWSLQTIDISRYADGNGALQLSFRQFGGPGSSGNRAGWNVDRFIVRSGNNPDFATCGACTMAPTFAGIVLASDADACADTGVTVSWDPAPTWGSGTGGTYAVYRDTTPAFTPSAANRVASGVAGTSWTDPGAPNGVAAYYIVRAENDETCSTGPHNGGMTDANAVVAGVTPTQSRPVPGAVQGLVATRFNVANVRLAWLPAADAASYDVTRATAPQPGGFASVGAPAPPHFDDLGAATDPATFFYLVHGVNACAQAGP